MRGRDGIRRLRAAGAAGGLRGRPSPRQACDAPSGAPRRRCQVRPPPRGCRPRPGARSCDPAPPARKNERFLCTQAPDARGRPALVARRLVGRLFYALLCAWVMQSLHSPGFPIRQTWFVAHRRSLRSFLVHPRPRAPPRDWSPWGTSSQAARQGTTSMVASEPHAP